MKALLLALAVLGLLSIFGWVSPSRLLGDDTTADLSGMPKLEPERVLRTPGAVTKLVWSSDGTKLAAAIIGQGAPVPFTGFRTGAFGSLIMVWEADGRIYRELRRKESFFNVGNDIAFVASDKQIVAPALHSSNTVAFSVFDLQSGEIVREVAGPVPDGTRFVNRAWRLVAMPDQQVLVVGFQGDRQPIALYSTQDWTKLGDLPDVSKPLMPSAATFSKDGRFLAIVRGGTVLIYETASRQIVQRFGPTFEPGYGFPNEVALSPDGSMVAILLRGFSVGSAGGTVLSNDDAVGVFSTRDASRIAFHNKLSMVNGLAWSPVGTFLAFTTRYKKLHFRDALKVGPFERTRELSSALSLAFSPDGAKLAVRDGENVRIFRIVN
ncbi:MAG TPA: hypothetical protein VFB68_19860 [Xanthobacteraceae bacterium]|nr:hypothetical protein [Xanthobacteraceae bacterium]